MTEGTRLAVEKRRSRLVTFRVRPDEFEAMSRACVELHARSVSELARSAVLAQMEVLGSPPTFAGNLLSLTSALRELDSTLSNLIGQLQELDATLNDSRKHIKAVVGGNGS